MKKINPFLWFDSEAEEAAKFYIGMRALVPLRTKVGDCELQASKSNKPVTFLHFTETGWPS